MIEKNEAELLVLEKLAKRNLENKLILNQDLTIDKPFGWVFICEASESIQHDEITMKAQSTLPVIVNRDSCQIVVSSKGYAVKKFIKLYEQFLSMHKSINDEWCLTFSHGLGTNKKKKLEKKVKASGFFEL